MPARARRSETVGVGLELLRGTSRSPYGTYRSEGRRGRGGLLAHPCFDLGREGRVLAQVIADVVSALAEALIAVGHPGPALVKDPVLDRGVDQRSLARDAFVEKNVELSRSERRRHLVLDHLDLHSVSDRIEAVLDDLDLADVQANGRVELQRPAAGLGLGVAEHDPNLLSQLVEEDDRSEEHTSELQS